MLIVGAMRKIQARHIHTRPDKLLKDLLLLAGRPNRCHYFGFACHNAIPQQNYTHRRKEYPYLR